MVKTLEEYVLNELFGTQTDRDIYKQKAENLEVELNSLKEELAKVKKLVSENLVIKTISADNYYCNYIETKRTLHGDNEAEASVLEEFKKLGVTEKEN